MFRGGGYFLWLFFSPLLGLISRLEILYESEVFVIILTTLIFEGGIGGACLSYFFSSLLGLMSWIESLDDSELFLVMSPIITHDVDSGSF